MKVVNLFIISIVALGGCATTETQTFTKDPLVRPGAVIELRTVDISPDKSYEIDAATLMRAALEEALAEQGIAWQGDSAADRFVLDVTVDDYEPGNAFKRWLLPGYGATIIHISGRLTDVSTGELAGELDHERSVYAGGAYTIGAWETIFATIAEDIATQLSNRINNKGFVVRLTPWPARDIEIPAAATKQTFEISSVIDSRPERGRIGERSAAFGVSMGSVFFDRNVPAFVQEAIGAELIGAGHLLTNDGTGRPVSINVINFWTHTNTTALYWDVIANIEIGVSVREGDAEDLLKRAAFSCETSRRTYVWPSLELVSEVIDECLETLMEDIRRDPIWTDT